MFVNSALQLHPATPACKIRSAPPSSNFAVQIASCNLALQILPCNSILQLCPATPPTNTRPHAKSSPGSSQLAASVEHGAAGGLAAAPTASDHSPQPLTTAHSLGARPALCCVQTFTPEFARAVWIHQILSSRGQ